MSHQTAWQKNLDTTKMSGEELKKLNLENAKRPPGQSPGQFMHQQGGVGIKRAGAYPFLLAGCGLVVAIGTLAYYTRTKPEESKIKDTTHQRRS
ncbi:hypothetical protein KP509_17G000100 [Ceratopteris richardii]|uniref:Uncharacterized protein n=1 Tax=Ceratopteris richardii TaxID=49495 RepID=A0A8T2SRL8_CERRI|nr:hypothetical protein KP509_17G000100 [Ceratopteris richardii]